MKNTWCVNAFHSLTVNTNGTVKTCCMATKDLPEKRVKFFKLEELFNDNFFKNIRNDLSQGIRNSNCDRCWEEEDAGRKSKRLRDNEIINVEDSESLRILELNLGNTCNIKCRTCGPWSSNQWIKEAYDLKKPDVPYSKFLYNFKHLQDSFEDDGLLWKSLDDALPNLTQIDFYGGEPFLSKKQWALVNRAVEKGYAKNLKVHYNTNGTIWNDDQIELLSHMRIADVSISVDGVEGRFEYMRNMAKWPVVNDNILKAIEWSKKNKNVVLTICYTISILNVWYIKEILDYGDKNGINIYLNLVHWPDHYSIQTMPTEIKEKVERNFRENIPSTHSAWFWLNGIISFMNQKEYDKESWNKFLTTTKIQDEYRKENYKETFNEFYNIIKPYTGNEL